MNRIDLHAALRARLAAIAPDIVNAIDWLEATDPRIDYEDCALAMTNAAAVLANNAPADDLAAFREYAEAFNHDGNEWHGEEPWTAEDERDFRETMGVRS